MGTAREVELVAIHRVALTIDGVGADSQVEVRLRIGVGYVTLTAPGQSDDTHERS